jgi:flagellar basal body rod protein FlgC
MTKSNFFIIGAGFTKAIFENAPLNNELVNAILDFNPSSQLKTLSEKYNTYDIELLLTKLDIDIYQGSYNIEIRNEINANIADYFQRFRFKPNILKEKRWLVEFASKSFSRDDTIINLNYDCFLEGLLDYLGIWNPNKGYGAIFNPLIDDSCVNINNIQILKVHGSENFTNQPIFDRPESSRVTFEFNENIFPKSAANIFFGPRSVPVPFDKYHPPKPYIIAPSYVKIPVVDIIYLMIDAIAASKISDKMIIIGCNLRPEDSFLWLLLTTFFRNPAWESRKFVILSPEANSIGKRISQFWGGSVTKCLTEIPFKLENSIDELCAILN